MAADEREVFFKELANRCLYAEGLRMAREIARAIVGVLRISNEFRWDPDWLAKVGAEKNLVEFVRKYGSKEQQSLIAMSRIRKLVESASADLLGQGKITTVWSMPDKEDGIYRIVQQATKTGTVTDHTLLTLAQFLRLDTDADLVDLARRLKISDETSLGVGKFVLQWHDPAGVGVSPENVCIRPAWRPEDLPQEGCPGAPLDLLPASLQAAFKEYLKVHDDNRPKVWLKRFEAPLTERRMTLEMGGMDWAQIQALKSAYSMPVTYRRRMVRRGLRELFENGTFHLDEDWYGNVTAHVVMLTSDEHLVLAQRSKNIKSAGGTYSPSFEEAWNPAEEAIPSDTVIRGLREEFKIDGTDSTPKLVAVGREWGRFWNTGLVYIVRLSVGYRNVLNSWARHTPQDKQEASGIVAVPLGKPRDRITLLKMLEDQGFSPSGSKGIKTAGFTRPGAFHPSTGLLRALFALIAVAGTDRVAAEAEEMVYGKAK